MKIRLLKIFAAVAVLLSFGGCSLLKVSVDTGNPPLPASEANTRMMTRGFYYDLADEIARTADSVAAASSEIPVRMTINSYPSTSHLTKSSRSSPAKSSLPRRIRAVKVTAPSPAASPTKFRPVPR